jgi:hypothetical protein
MRREKMNSMDLIHYMTLVAVMLLVLAMLIMERDPLSVVATLAVATQSRAGERKTPLLCSPDNTPP